MDVDGPWLSAHNSEELSDVFVQKRLGEYDVRLPFAYAKVINFVLVSTCKVDLVKYSLIIVE